MVSPAPAAAQPQKSARASPRGFMASAGGGAAPRAKKPPSTPASREREEVQRRLGGVRALLRSPEHQELWRRNVPRGKVHDLRRRGAERRLLVPYNHDVTVDSHGGLTGDPERRGNLCG